jgi:hypothetical protein
MQSKLSYVIAEFVPTTFIEGSTFTHLKIEENSGLSVNTIAYSKYIKPAHLRNKNQKVAHVVLGLANRFAANTAIQCGLFIEGKHVDVRKKMVEPRRCLKCQKFGHFVPDCKADTDTCARCNGAHRTSTCNVPDTSHFNCTNCTGTNAKGHGAADRNCPAFKAERENLHKRIPDNNYKYFPTSAPSTWKLLNETDHPAEPQYQRQQPANTNPHANNQASQQNPPNGWQTVRRSRPFAPLTQEDRHYVPRPRTDTYLPDKGWPSRPAQTTLDDFVNSAQKNTQSRPPSAPVTNPTSTPTGSESPPALVYV